MGAAVSSSHIVSATPSFSEGGLLTLSPAPAWGPSHRRQLSMSFSSTGPFCGLQFFTNCSSVGPFHGVQSFRNRLPQHGPPQGHKSCHETCSGMGSSLHGSTGPTRSLLQHRLPTRSQPPSGIHLLWGAQPWPMVGPSWSQLALALSAAIPVAPCYQNLATQAK